MMSDAMLHAAAKARVLVKEAAWLLQGPAGKGVGYCSATDDAYRLARLAWTHQLYTQGGDAVSLLLTLLPRGPHHACFKVPLHVLRDEFGASAQLGAVRKRLAEYQQGAYAGPHAHTAAT